MHQTPTTIEKAAVSSTTNFATETIHDSEETVFPSEAMLMITLADNRRVAVRPSGTEPKIKYYMFAAEPLSDGKTISGRVGSHQEACHGFARAALEGIEGRCHRQGFRLISS
jgi:hypothetical protein